MLVQAGTEDTSARALPQPQSSDDAHTHRCRPGTHWGGKSRVGSGRAAAWQGSLRVRSQTALAQQLAAVAPCGSCGQRCMAAEAAALFGQQVCTTLAHHTNPSPAGTCIEVEREREEAALPQRALLAGDAAVPSK